MASLSLLVKAVDTMSVWVDKINLSFAKADANEANVATNAADIVTNADDIATNAADIVTNADDIGTNTASLAGIVDGSTTLDAVQLDLVADPAWVAGQISYDPEAKTGRMDTGYTGVRVQIGQEEHIPFLNNTGVPITNGTLVNAGGVDVPTNTLLGIPCDISSPITSSTILGIATATVADGEMGLATCFGKVHDMDTSLLDVGGVLYAGNAGGYTQTFPVYPNTVTIVGTVLEKHVTTGHIFVNISPFIRRAANRSYSFSQANIGSGIRYLGGFYLHQDAAQALDQVTDYAYPLDPDTGISAHVFAVFSGPGSVTGGGQVGLKVTGTRIDDAGGQYATTGTPDVTEILTDNIETAALNSYFETSGKWVGTPTYELYIVSGSPSAYSVLINVGLAKYEDLRNQKFTITSLDIVGTAGANAVAGTFNMRLRKHSSADWSYHVSAFEPGDGIVADWSVDMVGKTKLVSGQPIAWKRTDIAPYIDGPAEEGLIIELDCPGTNTIETLSAHISGVVESL
jgi:hypothetical protein